MTVQLMEGDCVQVLKTLEAASVQCSVTSPPFYGLRDYGTAKWEGGDAACDHKNHRWPSDNKNKSAELPVRASIGMDVNLCPIGIDLNPAYLELTRERLAKVQVEF
jgi:hypothetical protein